MPLEAHDFTLTEGELSPSWFPEIDLDGFLKDRLKEANNDPAIQDLSGTKQRRAKEAFVYEKAYRHIYRRKAEDPSSWSADGAGSEQQSDRQVQRWYELAEEKEAELETLLEEDTGHDDLPPSTTASHRTGYA